MPNEKECDRHESWLHELETRLRGVEMEIAKSGARVALIAGVAAAICSTVLTVLGSLVVFWLTGKA